MLNIGVLGVGHLGKIHLNLLQKSKAFNLKGFYDTDSEKASLVEKETGIKKYNSYEDLLNDVDVIDIVTPTISHYNCAVKAIEKRKHFFIEKPLAQTVEEAEKLCELVKKSGLKAQVGHVERFNPAFLAALDYNLHPLFIEGHRLAEFKPRGTDVSVVLDLMIHDIDIILSLIKAEPVKVSASGVAVISDTIDIANARIEFENGSVANLTASRVSLKTERKLRIFQKNAYITIDFHKKETNIFQLKDLQEGEQPSSPFVFDTGNGKGKKEVFYHSPKPKDINSIAYELKLFAEAIENNKEPIVSVFDGYRSIALAHQVLNGIEELTQKAIAFDL
jgi:predicted dehydrogenase